MASATEIDFNKHYVVYGHGARDIIRSSKTVITSNFTLGQNYRIVTLHMPGKQIFKQLVKIILDKISTKSSMINDLFLINCPIARKICRERLENELITEYFSDQFTRYPEKTNKELNEIKNTISNDYESDDESDEKTDIEIERVINLDNLDLINIKTTDELNTYLQTNLNQIKKNLNFEIRLYRPGDLCPKLRMDFRIFHSLSLLKGGIFNINLFDSFDLENYELTVIRDKKQSVNSLVSLNNDFQYVFDNSDISDLKLSFFDTIKEQIPTGTLIVLSCGTYSNGINDNPVNPRTVSLVRANSLSRQNATFRKYIIKYN